MPAKKMLGMTVLQAAQERIAWAFDTFSRLYVSFSGGKDSTVMLHLVMEEAAKRQRQVGLLFVDLEGQYKLTIDFILSQYGAYHALIKPYWVALPLNLRNAVSQYEPQWMCWDPDRAGDWVRAAPKIAITNEAFFPFFRRRMEFEEFVPAFGQWYSQGQLCGCFVGIRTQESLNRWRSIASDTKQCFSGRKWTTWCGGSLFNLYPIYDWQTEDLWAYSGKYNKPYNALYDRMYQAGLTVHQMRICQPYGDDQRKGLWLFHVIEPETWARIVARVSGANQGALYARETGDILGRIKISKPPGHTWQSFAMLLLGSQPPQTAEHYRNKIAVFLRWYQERGYAQGIPDDGPDSKETPSWKRICKALLRNDYWCKGLSFSQHQSGAYQKYLQVMKNRRRQWNLMS